MHHEPCQMHRFTNHHHRQHGPFQHRTHAHVRTSCNIICNQQIGIKNNYNDDAHHHQRSPISLNDNRRQPPDHGIKHAPHSQALTYIFYARPGDAGVASDSLHNRIVCNLLGTIYDGVAILEVRGREHAAAPNINTLPLLHPGRQHILAP